MPIEALGAAASEFAVPSLGAEAKVADTTESTGASGGGFGGVLSKQLDGLSNLQVDAAQASRSLADGTATDPSQVVVAVERAQLAMQLAAQLRTKSVDAFSEIFRTQI